MKFFFWAIVASVIVVVFYSSLIPIYFILIFHFKCLRYNWHNKNAFKACRHTHTHEQKWWWCVWSYHQWSKMWPHPHLFSMLNVLAAYVTEKKNFQFTRLACESNNLSFFSKFNNSNGSVYTCQPHKMLRR